MTQINFDASQVDPSIPFDVLPSGKYVAEITKSEIKPTKAGDSTYLEFEFTILDGQYRGRKVWDRLCLNHRNQQTVEIARANLSAICHSVGVLKPRDSNELHHIPLTITVKLKHDYDTDNIYNEIKGYAKRDSMISNVSVATTGLATSQAAQYPQATVNDNTPPWVR
ncbi:MAG: DUF669 domain-containing protein [Planctomycetaceae bacterium]|jgi:hypothetical protein|nr:DUF669 domain-containing protein [Planctomycetaceae bacterium]